MVIPTAGRGGSRPELPVLTSTNSAPPTDAAAAEPSKPITVSRLLETLPTATGEFETWRRSRWLRRLDIDGSAETSPACPTILGAANSGLGDAGPCAGGSVVGHWLIGSPNAEQLGFSHIDGSPGTSGGSALTPQVAQIGETSASSVWSHRSLMA
jgi:hypothetical protein